MTAAYPLITPSLSRRATRAYALAREIWTRSARARMDIRPSPRSASTIRRSVSSIGAICPRGLAGDESWKVIWSKYRGRQVNMSCVLFNCWILGRIRGEFQEKSRCLAFSGGNFPAKDTEGGAVTTLADLSEPASADSLLPSVAPLQL